MYCKKCGMRLDGKTARCPQCGLAINYTDGGQTFYDDGELDEWSSENISSMNTAVPKTQMLNAEPTVLPHTAKDDKEKKPRKKAKHEKTTKRKQSRNRKKRYVITKPDRFIFFCIGVVLAVVFIIVGVLNLVGGNGEPATTNEPTISVSPEVDSAAESSESTENEYSGGNNEYSEENEYSLNGESSAMTGENVPADGTTADNGEAETGGNEMSVSENTEI